MSLNDFFVLETIGKGSFASVHKVIRKSDNAMYALKRVKLSKLSKKEVADALNEIRFLASFRHNNIVGFMESFLENNDTELCIVMEYCGCGDLAQKVERYKRRRKYIEENVIWRYVIQCLKALECFHDRGICHRDIKAANTFLSFDGSVKVGDMNISKRLKNGHLQTQIGTPYYMSPEIWNNRSYDASSDIWSLGCMIYELASLRPPFTGDNFPSLKRAVVCGRYSAIPKKYSDCLTKMISLMLRVNAKERPSAKALLKYPEIVSRLIYDDVTPLPSQRDRHSGLMETIKVPTNLHHLSNALPKPRYPDSQPISPLSRIAAEQRQEILMNPPPSTVAHETVLKPSNVKIVAVAHPEVVVVAIDSTETPETEEKREVETSEDDPACKENDQSNVVRQSEVEAVAKPNPVANPSIHVTAIRRHQPLSIQAVPRAPPASRPIGAPIRPFQHYHRLW